MWFPCFFPDIFPLVPDMRKFNVSKRWTLKCQRRYAYVPMSGLHVAPLLLHFFYKWCLWENPQGNIKLNMEPLEVRWFPAGEWYVKTRRLMPKVPKQKHPAGFLKHPHDHSSTGSRNSNQKGLIATDPMFRLCTCLHSNFVGSHWCRSHWGSSTQLYPALWHSFLRPWANFWCHLSTTAVN